MAKKFLDVLGDTFEENDLTDLIPASRKKRSSGRTSSASSKRKRLGQAITENIPPEDQKITTQRKSLLQTMEEAFEDEAFDDVFPTRPTGAGSIKPDPSLESRFSTMITTEVLHKARQIAKKRNIRVKDVINAALKIYVEEQQA